MPTGPLHGVRLIVNSTLALSPRSVVDIGMGTGKYGFLLRDQAVDRFRLVGVEGWEPYVGKTQRAVYDEIVVADALEYLQRCEARTYDITLALDVVEHFAPKRGLEFLDAALAAAGYVLISTPRGFYRQEGHENELEQHLSWWPEWKLRTAARMLSARIATAHDRLTVFAMLSRHGRPALATERLLETTNRLRTAVLPDRIYYPIRRKDGPSI